MATDELSVSYASALKAGGASAKGQVTLFKKQSDQEAEITSTLIESTATTSPGDGKGNLLGVA